MTTTPRCIHCHSELHSPREVCAGKCRPCDQAAAASQGAYDSHQRLIYREGVTAGELSGSEQHCAKLEREYDDVVAAQRQHAIILTLRQNARRVVARADANAATESRQARNVRQW